MSKDFYRMQWNELKVRLILHNELVESLKTKNEEGLSSAMKDLLYALSTENAKVIKEELIKIKSLIGGKRLKLMILISKFLPFFYSERLVWLLFEKKGRR